jgi:hypothetical protein
VAGVVGIDRHGRLPGQVVRGVEERTAPTGGDLLRGADLARVDLLVAGVVVEIPGEGQPQVELAWDQDRLLEVGEVAERLGVALELRPRRHGRGQDEVVAGPAVGIGHPFEVVQLGLVDEGVGLDVDAPEPPPVRELDREVAAGLSRAPAADPPALPELAQEPRQPVVPVVVAWNRVETRVGGVVGIKGRGPRQRGPPRPLEAVLVALGAGGGVDLVAPEHHELPAGQRVGEPADRERRLPHVVGHRGGGLEPVTRVGHVVDPELVLAAVDVIDRPGP